MAESGRMHKAMLWPYVERDFVERTTVAMIEVGCRIFSQGQLDKSGQRRPTLVCHIVMEVAVMTANR